MKGLRTACIATVTTMTCTTHPASVTMPIVSATAVAPVDASLQTACTVRVGQPRELAIPARLASLAAQYFHPGARSGFNDLIPGTNRYRWYDPADLNVAIEPPPDIAIIHRSTPSFLFGWGGKGYIARRTDKVATSILPAGLYDFDMVEDRRGHAWLLVGGVDPNQRTNVRLLDVDATLQTRDHSVVALVGVDPWDRQIGVTEDGHVAVVWVEDSTDEAVLLMVSWLTPEGFRSSAIIDRIDTSRAAVELALRTTTGLCVTSEGKDRLAVAWRPLTPAKNEVVDVGSASQPPEHEVRAEIRIVTIDPGGSEPARKIHVTRAQPLRGVSGQGPWAVQGNGLAAATLAGHAMFFWHEPPRVVYALVDEASPRTVTTGSYRLLPRPTPRLGLELLLLESVGPQQFVPIMCE